ncbi:MAG: hypothetical protein L6R38_005350 [Xanthoria sp. 2 TBL-2021]|nr:MAG: hypothetical protein L6R38_005350 [Xanthoria sp. 2 TBL-2021]
MISIRLLFISLLLQACAITICDALPPPIPQQNPQSPSLFTQNDSTSDNSFNPFSLSQRVNLLLDLQSHSRDATIRRASLTGVFLSWGSGEQTLSSDPRRLHSIIASFRVHGDPPRPGFRETLVFSDAGGGDWRHLHRISRTQEIWEKEHEIDWKEVERLMTLEEADSRIKAAGFVWPLRQIEIQQFDDFPLAYCFKFIHGNVNAACVGMLDKHVWAGR